MTQETLHAELAGHEPPVAARDPAARPQPRGQWLDQQPFPHAGAVARRTDNRGSEPAAHPRMQHASAAAHATTAAPAPAPRKPVYVGIDLGTSSCRAVAIDEKGELLAQAGAPIPLPMKSENQITQDPLLWWKAVSASLAQLFKAVGPERVAALAVDGTSGTLLLTDAKGAPVTPALMYNDARAVAEAESLLTLARSEFRRAWRELQPRQTAVAQEQRPGPQGRPCPAPGRLDRRHAHRPLRPQRLQQLPQARL